MTYIATFYSHFGAVRFKKRCDTLHIPAKLMPVPRSLSSSCGTCVRYEGCFLPPEGDETEQVVEVHDFDYVNLYTAQEN